MNCLSDEQKKELIETAQDLFRKGFNVRLNNDIFAQEINIKTFKEACGHMSQLIHYLAKDIYEVDDEDNLIYDCEFKYNGFTYAHTFNIIYNRIVDSTIMQFQNLSPYDSHDECYCDLRLKEPCYDTIQYEIDLHGIRWYCRNVLQSEKKKKKKLFNFNFFNK